MEDTGGCAWATPSAADVQRAMRQFNASLCVSQRGLGLSRQGDESGSIDGGGGTASVRVAAAAQAAAGEGAITTEAIERHLFTADLPPVDLLIRTSGEVRLSNFLLWQMAYAEMMFVDTLWPDFTPRHLEEALGEFAKRERRYGGR